MSAYPLAAASIFWYIVFISILSTPFVHANTTLTLVSPQEVRTEYSFAGSLENGCPRACQMAGPDPANWTYLHDQQDLLGCDGPLLFDFNVKNEPTRYTAVRACIMADGSTFSPSSGISSASLARRVATNVYDLEAVEQLIASSDSCGAQKTTSKAYVSVGATKVLQAGNDAAAAAELLVSHFTSGSASCGTTILFAKSGPAVVGLYAGADIQKSSVGDIVNQFR